MNIGHFNNFDPETWLKVKERKESKYLSNIQCISNQSTKAEYSKCNV